MYGLELRPRRDMARYGAGEPLAPPSRYSPTTPRALLSNSTVQVPRLHIPSPCITVLRHRLHLHMARACVLTAVPVLKAAAAEGRYSDAAGLRARCWRCGSRGALGGLLCEGGWDGMEVGTDEEDVIQRLWIGQCGSAFPMVHHLRPQDADTHQLGILLTNSAYTVGVPPQLGSSPAGALQRHAFFRQFSGRRSEGRT
ncbi:hypothetical protein MSAN_02374400 [Mycena sanguinolenta]|uniref:Uncharacterized protein n=1 Tax=Mycena sanguinolenta TaxID=230812 RepID=A0A8H6X687_9AGAR|nr:hypothetical protein MSAN_02374400 [Mycena sanguinolenta]